MTATTTVAASAAPRRIPLAPPEGWLSLGLVLVLALALAWSLDDARLVLGRDVLTDFLVWAAVGGVLAGFLGAQVGWGRWRTHGIGAIFAALLIPLIVGATLLGESGASLHDWFVATADATARAVDDLIIKDNLTTTQVGHHLLVLGLLVWASAQAAAFTVFGHRRPLNAVLLLGVLLVGNMSVTTQPQLPYLVIFSMAALFLLIRWHTFEEQTDWLRRRIGDPTAIAGMYLRGGTVFIVATVLGSLLLTSVASSAPLAGAWSDVGAQVIDWSRSLSRFLPQSGTGVALAPSFGRTSSITGTWFTSDGVALTVDIPQSQIATKPYWRAAVYDLLLFDGFDTSSDGYAVDRVAEEELLEGLGDDLIETGGRTLVEFRITPSTGDAIFAPQTPVSVDVPVQVEVVGDEGFFARAEHRGSGDSYTIRSLIPAFGDDEATALTKNKLRVAGTDYPAAIAARYAAQVEDGILGPEALRVLADIRQQGATNAYDFAEDVVQFLRSNDNFHYDPDITDDGNDCTGLSSIECFATYRRGYCEHYAAMMAAFLRESGIPARVAMGYLPGSRNLTTEVVTYQQAHAWVEAYFPGYGWVDFDPTGGGVPQLQPLPEGDPRESGAPSPSASGSGVVRPPEPSERVDNEPGGNGGSGTPDDVVSAGPLIAVSLLLGAIVLAVAVAAWRRGPRGPVTAEGAYGMVTRLASRFGFAPRPEQTVYEFAGALADVLPGNRPELETVARAKVEVAYGGRALGADRLAGLREAQRRLRIGLLRLAVKRGRRGTGGIRRR